jgi:class 3 adenylate cyclase
MFPQHLASGRTDTVLRTIGVLIWLAVVAVVAVSLGSWAARGFPPQPASWSQGVLGVAAITIVALVYTSVAAALVGRAPRNLIGWVFFAIGVSMAVVIPLNNSFEGIFHAVRPVPQSMLLMGWGTGSMLLPGSVLAATIVLILFPSGRPEAPHWRLTLWLSIAGFVSLTVSTAMRPEGLLWYPALPNPLGLPGAVAPLVFVGSVVGVVLLVAGLVLAASWLAQRYRHAHAVQRRQLLWVALGASAMTLSVAILFLARYLGTISDEDGQLIMLVAALGSVLFPLTLFRFVTVTAAQGVDIDDVTFLFTDLQDSTLMYERIGDATAYDLVRDHFRVLESATRAHGGVIVKTIGDAIMARFRIPAQAVRTALDMRERIEQLAEQGTADLVLRIGLHRGPAIAVVARDRVDYFGHTVNAASRIQAAALPGEIVLSDDVYRGLGVTELLVGYELVSERRKLRGVTTEMLLHRVAAGVPRPVAADDAVSAAPGATMAAPGATMAAPGALSAADSASMPAPGAADGAVSAASARDGSPIAVRPMAGGSSAAAASLSTPAAEAPDGAARS